MSRLSKQFKICERYENCPYQTIFGVLSHYPCNHNNLTTHANVNMECNDSKESTSYILSVNRTESQSTR